MGFHLVVTCSFSDSAMRGLARISCDGPPPASATIPLCYPGSPDALEWLTSRRHLRADALRLLAAIGIDRASGGDIPHKDRVRALMRELWAGLTGRPVADLVLARETWAGLSRVEREILRAQWQDGLGVQVELLAGQPESRREAIDWCDVLSFTTQ